MSEAPKKPVARYVPHLPDLMTPADYVEAPEVRKIRLEIRMTDAGIEILGDSPYPVSLDELLEKLGPETVEKMLCG